MINHARRKDWLALWEEGECNENQYYTALSRFYEDNPFPAPACGEPVAFTWDIHRKASQLCYSLSTDIMVRIQKGIYPFGSYLPSPKMLASEYHVGLNTVRRAIDLLNVGKCAELRFLGQSHPAAADEFPGKLPHPEPVLS